MGQQRQLWGSVSDGDLRCLQETLRRAVPTLEGPFQEAVECQFSRTNDFALARLCYSLHPSREAATAGVALDLIRVGFRRLHRLVDRSRDAGPGLGVSANVLVGDCFSTAAFRLMVSLHNLELLQIVAEAVTKNCELDAAAVCCETSCGRAEEAAGPLGDAAGHIAARLARIDSSGMLRARLFG